MLYFLLVLFILYIFLNHEKKKYTDQVVIGTYKSKNFTYNSLKLYSEMKQGGLSEQSLMEFAMMEDQFMAYEKQSVCNEISSVKEAVALNEQMKDRFPGWDFSYHLIHIKQMAEPHKLINRNLRCF